jgi:hypothetical protein
LITQPEEDIHLEEKIRAEEGYAASALIAGTADHFLDNSFDLFSLGGLT